MPLTDDELGMVVAVLMPLTDDELGMVEAVLDASH